jgi:hypothetical protein
MILKECYELLMEEGFIGKTAIFCVVFGLLAFLFVMVPIVCSLF